MGYQSKVRVLAKGSKSRIDDLCDVMKQRSKVSHLGDHYVKPEIYWQNVSQMHKRVDRGDISIVIYDSSWFKAYGEWDDFVDSYRELCEEFEIDWSYARIGEAADDYDSDSNDPEGYIFLSREFELPITYGAVLYGEDGNS